MRNGPFSGGISASVAANSTFFSRSLPVIPSSREAVSASPRSATRRTASEVLSISGNQGSMNSEVRGGVSMSWILMFSNGIMKGEGTRVVNG